MKPQNSFLKNQTMQRKLYSYLFATVCVLSGLLVQAQTAIFAQDNTTEIEKQLRKNLKNKSAKPPRSGTEKSNKTVAPVKTKKKVAITKTKTLKQPDVKVEERQQVTFKTGAVDVEIWSNGKKLGISDKAARLTASLGDGEHLVVARKYDQNLFESIKIVVSSKQNSFDFSAEIAKAVDNLRQTTQIVPVANKINDPQPVDANAVLRTYQDPQTTDSITVKDWQAVYDQCRSSVELGNNNNNVEALCLFAQGQIELSLENRPKAISLFRGAVTMLPNSPILHYGLGVAHGAAGDAIEATNSFAKVIKLDNKFALAYQELGKIYQAQNKIKEAANYFQQAVRLGVNSPDLRLWIVENQIKNKDCSAVIKELESLSKDAPSVRGLTALSDCYIEQKRAHSAIEVLGKAIELEPKSAVPHYRVGIIYLKQKEFSKAKDSFERAAELDPEGKTINRKELKDLSEKAQKRANNE